MIKRKAGFSSEKGLFFQVRKYQSSSARETNTANNNFTGSVVTVTIPGDINGDFKVARARYFKVGLPDLVLLANAYGTTPNSPPGTGLHQWNPNADLFPPWNVIGLSDLVTLALHYGQHYP